jgi:hypothetical protein
MLEFLNNFVIILVSGPYLLIKALFQGVFCAVHADDVISWTVQSGS